MKKSALVFCLILVWATPSFAFVTAILEGAEKAREEAYRQFMMLKAVQHLKALSDTYKESKNYYELMKKISEGQTCFPVRTNRVMDMGEELAAKQEKHFAGDWRRAATPKDP